MGKTFIRWFGNKSKYLKHIIPLLPDRYNTYIEPFLGSGALFMHLQPQKWIVNDINTDLINVWKHIKSSDKLFIHEIKSFGKQFVKLSNDDKIIVCRQIVTQILPTMQYNLQRAVTFLLMKFCVYMGILIQNHKYRFSGLENTIYYNRPLYFLSQTYFDVLRNTSIFLNSSTGSIFNKDFKSILHMAKEGDFVFLDPPYFDDHEYCVQYNHNENINTYFIEELLQQLITLDKKNVKWLLTQADNKVVRKLFKKYHITSYKVFRIRSGKYKKELIIKNY